MLPPLLQAEAMPAPKAAGVPARTPAAITPAKTAMFAPCTAAAEMRALPPLPLDARLLRALLLQQLLPALLLTP
jgi:hypothetical protein